MKAMALRSKLGHRSAYPTVAIAVSQDETSFVIAEKTPRGYGLLYSEEFDDSRSPAIADFTYEVKASEVGQLPSLLFSDDRSLIVFSVPSTEGAWDGSVTTLQKLYIGHSQVYAPLPLLQDEHREYSQFAKRTRLVSRDGQAFLTMEASLNGSVFSVVTLDYSLTKQGWMRLPNLQ
jgi:hypothetical protein